jgi:Na+/H+ antiporter NhaD/arsenite permease-like protein
MLLPLIAEGFVMIFGADGNSAFGQFLQRYQNHEFNQTIVNISLGVVVSAITLAIILSIIFPPKHSEDKIQDSESKI